MKNIKNAVRYYESIYPNDKRLQECLNYIESLNDRMNLTNEQKLELKNFKQKASSAVDKTFQDYQTVDKEGKYCQKSYKAYSAASSLCTLCDAILNPELYDFYLNMSIDSSKSFKEILCTN